MTLARTICIVSLTYLAVAGLQFKLSPHEELCFHEIAHRGNKVLAFFDVLSWGYGAYAYLVVTSPTGRELKRFDAQSEGKVDFYAEDDGEYNFCFKNHQSETEISFSVNLETDYGLSEVAKEEHVEDMQDSVDHLHSIVSAAKVDLSEFRLRESQHRHLAKSNKRRVVTWAIVECVLVFFVAVGQVVRIRKFFEQKMTV
mmetsp:Transcript_6499/g.13008  ORF Transcript_6499/g.13008 Transcript_6499/m.13008 type:complete len:199 (-) Transcript_6499:124-720(-)